MAESNQYRHDPSTTLDDDDPMLELARIMGPQSFDKVAVRPVEEDFGINLEQEMLGEFSEPAQADTAEKDRIESNAAPDFDYSDTWPPAERQVESAAGSRDAPATGEPETPHMRFEAFTGSNVMSEAVSGSTRTGDPLLDEMFSLDDRDSVSGDTTGHAYGDAPALAGEPASREVLDEDEELLAADLAALERAFSDHDPDETSTLQDWQEPAESSVTNETPAGDDLETTAFDDIKASLAGLEDSPNYETGGGTRDRSDDRAEISFADDKALRPGLEHEWDTYDERTDFDSDFGRPDEVRQVPPVDTAESAADLWPETGAGAPPTEDTAAADTEHYAGDLGDLGDMADFDEDAFLEQNFLDDELLAELELDDAAPEPVTAPADADTQWSGMPDGDDFDRALDLDPAAYEMDDAGNGDFAPGESDGELATAIEDTFDLADDGSDAAPPAYAATANAYDVPEIETTEIDDGIVPETGDLDIPDFEPETVVQVADPLGGYDTGYEEAPERNEATAAALPPESGEGSDFESYFAEEFSQMGFDLEERQDESGGHYSEEAALAAVMRATQEIGRRTADKDLYSEAAGAGREKGRPARERNRQGLMIAAAVAGIAVLGAVGAFTLTSGGSDNGGEPAIVRADPEPVKVKPAEPGGTQVPNADKKVYEQVAGAQANGDPEQKTLVTTGEEPIDVASAPVTDTPSDVGTPAGGAPKSEDRIDPALTDSGGQADGDIIAVAPRRVKTFVVQPDGTLVQRESSEPVDTAAEPSEAEAEPVVAAQDTAPESGTADQDAGVPVPQARPNAAASDTASAEPEPVAPAVKVEQQTAIQDAEPSAKPAPAAAPVPTNAPVIASRPANQPVNIIGRTGTTGQSASTQAALADTTVGSSNTSPAWVQISSHSSPDLAQVSYRNDLKRYGSLISGRGVNIVAADVRGQTWYRVNIPAQSWSDAAGLCQKIKAAGGDCLPKR